MRLEPLLLNMDTNRIKPRNHVILAMLKMGRKTIVHQKSNKAKRRIEKVKLKDEV